LYDNEDMVIIWTDPWGNDMKVARWAYDAAVGVYDFGKNITTGNFSVGTGGKPQVEVSTPDSTGRSGLRYVPNIGSTTVTVGQDSTEVAKSVSVPGGKVEFFRKQKNP
jgi:hypothetical protein